MFMYPAQHGVVRVIKEKGSCSPAFDFPAPLASVEWAQITLLVGEKIIQWEDSVVLVAGPRFSEVE